jgi:hypothetical protein
MVVVQVRIQHSKVRVLSAMEGYFIHDLPPCAAVGLTAASEGDTLRVDGRTQEAHAVEQRHRARECFAEDIDKRVNVEGKQEAEGAHRETQDGRAFARRKQVRDVQHRPVAAEREHQVCLLEEQVCTAYVSAMLAPSVTYFGRQRRGRALDERPRCVPPQSAGDGRMSMSDICQRVSGRRHG